jgi:hypothetical protein
MYVSSRKGFTLQQLLAVSCVVVQASTTASCDEYLAEQRCNNTFVCFFLLQCQHWLLG